MKNLHILPTDKPSRLHLKSDGFYLTKEENSFIPYSYPKNIYITSDEEIKEGDCSLGFALGIKGVGRGFYVFKQDGTNIGKLNAICNESKKIILTTDQDLIKDGVQAIDDEFLEWFVNNPSCEEVGVEVDLSKHNGKFQTKYGWKIIIPKEEPKQTAVEWLYSELINHLDMPHRHIQELVEQAKEMEKQQIIDSYDDGNPNGFIDKDGEQYYKETFKKK